MAEVFTEMEFVELHNPLFLGGKNFGVKLEPSKITGLKLNYNETKKQLFITWNNKLGRIPESNVACMVEKTGTPIEEIQQKSHPHVAGIAKAQVETPMSHVHAGLGAGQTGVKVSRT